MLLYRRNFLTKNHDSLRSPLSPSVVRRKSLMSLGSRAHAIENFAAAQPRFLMFSPFKPFRQVWDMSLGQKKKHCSQTLTRNTQ